MLYLTVTVLVNLTIGLSGPRAAAIVNVALPCFKALNPGIFPHPGARMRGWLYEKASCAYLSTQMLFYAFIL